MTAALRIERLTVEYPRHDGAPFAAVRDLSLDIEPGEIHALVGESGAGKSTVGNCVLGLLEAPGRIAGGTIHVAGRRLETGARRGEGTRPGRDIGAIFQDPMTSLNPLFTVEAQLAETMRHHLGLTAADARHRALTLLEAVEIPDPARRLRQYPHQLSGGQRQRVVIAAALSCEPALLIADEPTTALDVSVQATILDLIRSLVAERRLGVLLITHNMGVVAQIADRVTVMRHGERVETGPTVAVLRAPQAPYARALIGAVPRLDRRLDRFPLAEAPEAAEAEAQRVLAARHAQARPPGPLLEVKSLDVTYGGGLLSRGGFRAVEGASFVVERGEIFGIVGESGSGKSTLAGAIAGLIQPSDGRIAFAGETLGRRRSQAQRRAIQMVFQDPYASLNARMRIGAAIREPVAHFHAAPDAGRAERTLIEAVGLPGDVGRRHPHAFSGGQRQRLSIARALAAGPDLLVADEPTSALDVSVQARVLNLLKDLRDRAGLTILMISHDLAVIRQMCDRVAVMRDGRIVEMAECETLFARPRDAYTRTLLSLVPTLDGPAGARVPIGA